MPRGRHRHSPPLHRLLPPSAIAGVSVVCALGPWAFSEATVLRALAAAAAATAVAGAVVMRRWDTQAGRQVAELMRARAGDEWRFEERVAELETDLEESRALRGKLEQRLRAKRAELAGLRNEHAALLRRYATAETERASALEGRRLLELETTAPGQRPAASLAPALPPARRGAPAIAGPARPAAPASPADPPSGAAGEGPAAAAVFSPEGARLYRRALTALARLDPEAPGGSPDPAGGGPEGGGGTTTGAGPGTAEPGAALPGSAGANTSGRGTTGTSGTQTSGTETSGTETSGTDASGAAAEGGETETGAARPVASESVATGSEATGSGEPPADAGATSASGPGTRPAAPPSAVRRQQPSPAQPAAGRFAVPAAVAVVPAPPVRRPVTEGGFDFFGTQKGAPKAALDAVQNEDLADVVGPEALAVHKAEAESGFKPADERSRGVGQVIDLTAHDETEQIDVQGLRSAAS
ncbi:hypothetical protein [Streptomyces sp. NPDC017095]|uniref:hypothetical protein n=1 Tax=Streptomyces sp. NPDC017095 TaxID=3364977 RepID=UPI00379F5487